MAEIELRQLKQRLALSLDEKIKYSIDRIMEWYAYWDGLVYVAFSGGKDSTVLAHLVRSVYPDVPLVFCNTGLEFPETISFVKTIDNLTVLRPKLSFKQVLDKYGYPVVSKKMAEYIYQATNAKGDTATRRLRMTGIKTNGEYSQLSKISKRWQFLVDHKSIKVAAHCCNIMKKYPSKAYGKETKRYPYTGEMVSEGGERRKTYLTYGCNAYKLSSQPKSTPLAIWTEKNIWDYIKRFNVVYSKIYDMGYTRTGCIYCGFGVHLEKGLNRFQRLKQTHPDRWRYCMDKLGLREVMKVYGVPIEENQMCLSLNENI
jgi:3'-phosphoadenosine 5'-phosphosulfate sulfotransferase (PAPS reductase)/FAD synthetase